MRYDSISALNGLTYTGLSSNVGPPRVPFRLQCIKCEAILLSNEYLFITRQDTRKQLLKDRMFLRSMNSLILPLAV